jgi:hypothetical protein
MPNSGASNSQSSVTLGGWVPISAGRATGKTVSPINGTKAHQGRTSGTN